MGWNYFQGGRLMTMVMNSLSMVFSPGGCCGGGGAVSAPGGQGRNGSGDGGDGVWFPVDRHVWLLVCVG